jgi:hypothetical protein
MQQCGKEIFLTAALITSVFLEPLSPQQMKAGA